ncbi:STAS domain-containing protein [Kitasatospora sp. NPDC001540]|uniref:STAS domain-containing protein n=1 Tax=Kitasatospora sp. NPDC001540 TaxID=3364014 RepID=UPI00369C899E
MAPAQEDLHISAIELPGRVRVVRLEGETDAVQQPRLRAAMSAAVRSGVAGVVVDLSRLRFCDSCGLRELVLAHGNPEGVVVVLAAPTAQFLRLAEITGVDQVVAIRPTVAAALTTALAAAARRGPDLPPQ